MKTLKSIIVWLVVILISIQTVSAQMVKIPDNFFKIRLLNLGYAPAFNTTQDSIDASHSMVLNTHSLNLASCQISNLNGLEAFTSLDTLQCSYNFLASLPTVSSSIKFLGADHNLLTSITAFPTSLVYCDISYNHLTSIPSLSSYLQYFDCKSNQLNALPTLPNSITNLNCGQNSISTISALPSSLLYFACDQNLLSNLPTLPSSLFSLNCNNNQLSSLPVLPSTLTDLNCSVNQLSSLPTLPSGLITLLCSENPLGILPTLPSNLMILFCNNNQLASYPLVPNSVEQLSIGNNLFSSIPSLPPALIFLECSELSLNNLPSLPSTLTYLDIHSNLFYTIPSLPDSLKNLFCYGNPMTCLPPLPIHLNHLMLDTTYLQCLPNNILGDISQGDIFATPVTLPLCGISTPSACATAWNISGVVFYDSNSNCSRDISENVLSNVNVELWNGGSLIQQTITNTHGEYSFDVNTFDTFEVRIDTAQYNMSASCPMFQSLTSIISAIDSLDGNMDFGIKCASAMNDKQSYQTLSVSGVYFPASTITLLPLVGQFGYCNPSIGGKVKLYKTGPIHFTSVLSSSLSPSFLTADSVIWDVIDFNTIDFQNDFKLECIVDTNAQSNDQVCYELTIESYLPDATPLNNTSTSCFVVTNSFDPNDKSVQPSGNISPDNEWLTYTIRFQNTGTAAAQNIVIKDTIDSNLQLNTFELLSFSHEPLVEIGLNRVIRFSFPAINLPDSTSDEVGSHGYITYRFKQNANLPISTSIQNTAYIYFDFNPPVVTNTTSSIISNPTSVSQVHSINDALKIYPNPANEQIKVGFALNKLHTGEFLVYDITGRLISRNLVKSNSNETDLNISTYKSGIYMITYDDKHGIKMSRKFVKQ